MMKIGKVFGSPLLRAIAVGVVVSCGTAVWAAPYVPPTGIGAPGRRESAGTRGCVFGNPAQLIALMPTANIGWTTAAYPRFYWYLPVNQAQFLEFTLSRVADEAAMDDAGEVIYSTRFAVTGESGLMSLQLPSTVSLPPLAVGDRYRWQVAVFCNPDSPNGDLQVDGWIERHLPDEALLTALKTASEVEKADLYASQGYWFDAVQQLATLQTSYPDHPDISTRWSELLESVDLGNLAEQPLTAGE